MFVTGWFECTVLQASCDRKGIDFLTKFRWFEEEFNLPNVKHMSIVLHYGYLLPSCAERSGVSENLDTEIQDLSRK